MAFDNKTEQASSVLANSSGGAVVTFSPAYPAGTSVIIVPSVVVPSGGTANNYNAQVVSVSNTGAVLQANVQSGAAITLLGLSLLSLFSAAPSGTVIHWIARPKT